MSPNVAWSGSLESYHPYLQAKKVSNIPKIECIHSGLPKTAKSHFGRLGPLGFNTILADFTFKVNHAFGHHNNISHVV
jgi:hypothetical protein